MNKLPDSRYIVANWYNPAAYQWAWLNCYYVL